MSDKYLVLYLDAPMQAWGADSRFDRRNTWNFPTKSGVIGMLAAAMGIDRKDQAGLREIANLAMRVVALSRATAITDYQTIGGGYDSKVAPDSIPRRATGKSGKDAVVSPREYLVNGKFGVFIKGPADIMKKCADALDNPVWGIWLGRKACVPAEKVCLGVFDNFSSAFEQLRRVYKMLYSRDLPDTLRVVDEVGLLEGTETLFDIPRDFHERIFDTRRVDVANVDYKSLVENADF